ncbi:xenobiotic acyltransferase family protein [Coraliomargarita sp. W4R72]
MQFHLLGRSGKAASVSLLATVKKSQLGENCCIKKWGRVSHSTLGPDCRIGTRAVVKMSQCFGNNSLGSRVHLNRVSLGLYSYIARDSILKDISIGKFCSIGPNVRNQLGNHPTQVFVSTHPAFYSPDSPPGTFVEEEYFDEFGEDVRVGNDVWIGADSLLMDGITIGDGAIIAARSVVTQDVPPYAIVGGTPAKMIRFRFDEETIDCMQKLNWWDQDPSWIQQHAPLFRDAQQLIEALKTEANS